MRVPMPAYDEWDELYGLVRDLFMAGAITCVLYAAHRLANGVMLGAQVKALNSYTEAYTPEEREVLVHKIKIGSMRY